MMHKGQIRDAAHPTLIDKTQRDLLVSIVVPCLNRAHLLESTLETILTQDYSSIECIVVDGGSIC